jgi:hypothetical protein
MDQPRDSSQFTPDLIAELQAAIERAMKGIRDPEAMRSACESMDRTREEIFRRNGLLDFAVPTIRALRDGDDERSTCSTPLWR